MGGGISGYSLRRVMGGEAGKREPLSGLKRLPPLHFKKGGWVGRNKGLKTIVGPSHPTNLKKFCPLMRVY